MDPNVVVTEVGDVPSIHGDVPFARVVQIIAVFGPRRIESSVEQFGLAVAD